MNQRKINFNAELIDNQIVIKLTSDDGNSKLANQAASKLFSSLEKVGIESIRHNLQKNWQNDS